MALEHYVDQAAIHDIDQLYTRAIDWLLARETEPISVRRDLLHAGVRAGVVVLDDLVPERAAWLLVTQADGDQPARRVPLSIAPSGRRSFDTIPLHGALVRFIEHGMGYEHEVAARHADCFMADYWLGNGGSKV